MSLKPIALNSKDSKYILDNHVYRFLGGNFQWGKLLVYGGTEAN